MLVTPSNSKIPFKFQHRQFLLTLSFAMTINKSQGQSLSTIGLYFPLTVFTHDQLYVALSKIRSRHGIKISLANSSNDESIGKIKNVVYRKIFQNVK